MDTFDVYVHTDRVAMPAELGWVVTVVRERDGRMQQFAGWDHQFTAFSVGNVVLQMIEFAGNRATLHPAGEHPDYDRAPAYPEPAWDDAADAIMEV